MNAAVDLKYTDNMEFKQKKFKKIKEDTHAVYLTEKELRELYRFDLSDNKRLEQVRDLFLFASFTGLRFGDSSNVKPENIVKEDEEYYIKIISQKTKTAVTAPCNDIIRDIFMRYKDNTNKLPNAISNQKFNEYIKEVCELAGFLETGRLINDPQKKLYECITSHTARRNFCTNMYLVGARPFDIMAVSGHKTEKEFLKYIKVTRDQSAKNLREISKKNQLKVV
jgi:integrase